MATTAGQMDNVAHPNPQWWPCNGATYYGYVPLPNPPRPHAGVSTGTRRDYVRNAGFSRTRGIGGWLIKTPTDPSATWVVSFADDSGEAAVSGSNTVNKPPPGVA